MYFVLRKLISFIDSASDAISFLLQIKWMEDEVWLNIDYGQYEITKRTSDSAGAGIGGKIVTKVTVGNADDKVNFFRGCLQVWQPTKLLLCLLFGFTLKKQVTFASSGATEKQDHRQVCAAEVQRHCLNN